MKSIAFRQKRNNDIAPRRTKRDDLAKLIRRELQFNQSRPAASRPTFVSDQVVRAVWNIERIRKFLDGLGWRVDDVLPDITRYFLKILSILVWIDWDNWREFKNIFLDHRDNNGSFKRCDFQLPFTHIPFFGDDEISQQNFWNDQYIFKPVVIREDVHEIYHEKYLLPFMESKEIGGGAFGAVTKELVEAHHLWWTKGGVNGQVRSFLQSP
jgi:hypothetical protein